VDDEQLWNLGAVRLKALLTGLSGAAMTTLKQLLAHYRKTKEALAAVVAEVDAADVCRECAGQCCLNGKYRVNVLDAAALISVQTQADFSRKPVCPYGSDAGCSMEPALRPADCVLFICDAIDRTLSPQARLILAEKELELRECIQAASCVTGEPMGTPLLLWAEKRQ